MKPLGAEYDQNFLGPYTGLNSEYSIARHGGRGGWEKEGKSEQKVRGKSIGSDTVAPVARGKEFPTSAYRFDRLLLLFEQTFVPAVSSHPYNYTAISFCSSTYGPSGPPLSRFSPSFAAFAALLTRVMSARSVIKYGAVSFQPSLDPPRLSRNCASFFSFLLTPSIYCG